MDGNMDLSTTKPLKAIFLIHFTLMSWGVEGYWSPDSYLFNNVIFLALVAWAIHSKDEPDPAQLALGVNVIAMFLDVIILSSHDYSSRGMEKFSFAMAIINLLVRVPSTLVLFQNCKKRLGSSDGMPNIFGERRGREPYEDIDARS